MSKKISILISTLMYLICFKSNAQNLLIPTTEEISLNWVNPDGTSGLCGSPKETSCSTTICLGESICFSYHVLQTQAGNQDLYNYNINHTSLSFSDGGSIIVENDDYLGPNATGCVNYVPITTGTITTFGVNNSTFSIIVLPAATPTLAANISPNNVICQGSQICAESQTSNIINYNFSSLTDINCFGTNNCNTPNSTPFCFPSGNHQILYTVNAGHTCSNTAIYNVQVVPTTLSLSVVSPTSCSNNYCFNAYPSNSCNLGNINYQWTISGSSDTYQTTNYSSSLCYSLSPGVYYISVEGLYTDPYLFAQMTLTVPPTDACNCFTCNSIGTSGTINNSPTSNQQYCIDNNVTISGNVSFFNT